MTKHWCACSHMRWMAMVFFCQSPCPSSTDLRALMLMFCAFQSEEIIPRKSQEKVLSQGEPISFKRSVIDDGWCTHLLICADTYAIAGMSCCVSAHASPSGRRFWRPIMKSTCLWRRCPCDRACVCGWVRAWPLKKGTSNQERFKKRILC